MGSVSCRSREASSDDDDDDEGEEEEEVCWMSSSRVFASMGSMSEGLARGPRKPMPPAEETAIARAGPLKMRMGAEIMRGVVIQG